MKKLTGILALLVFAGNIASAELLKDFKHDGKVTVNGYTTKNNNVFDSKKKQTTSDVDTRVELNMGFSVTQDVDAVVSAVKCNRQYNGASENIDGITAAVTFEQAYLNLKGVLGVDHKIGRQYYGDAGSIVLYYGPTPWPYANGIAGNGLGKSGLDGWTGWYKNDKLAVHAISAKQANSVAMPNTDTDLVGVAGRYDLMELLNVGAYFYEQKMYGNATTADNTLDIAGVKGDGKFSPLNLSYYGEMAKNYGHKAAGVNYTGTAFIAGGKMEMDLIGKWTFMGEFASGTGDKTSVKKDEGFADISADYRPGVIWGGIRLNSGLTNLTTWNLGANWNTPMFEKLTLGGKLYHFGYNQKVTSAGNQTTSTIGNELDLTANWQHNENVGLMAYYGAFVPTSKYTKYACNSATAKDDMVTALGLALNVKF